MLKLMKKDLLAARFLLGANLAALVLFSIQPHFSGGFILVFAVVLAISSLAAVYFYEDRNRTEVLYLSLPVKRKDIVVARHVIAAGFLAAFGLVMFGIIAPLESRLAAGPDPFPLRSIEAAALYMVLGAILISLYLTCQYRFGFGRGSIAFVIVAVILFTAIVAAVVIRFPADFDAAKNEAGVRTIFGSLQALRTSAGTPLFLLAAAVLVLVPFLVSLPLSRRFYARREF